MNISEDNNKEAEFSADGISHAEPLGSQPPQKFTLYDLFYGILLEPVKTFRMLAEKTPLGLTVLLVLGLNLILAIMNMFGTNYDIFTSMFNSSPYMGEAMTRLLEAAAPIAAVVEFTANIVWWFVYAGLLHLLAEFYGGQGRAVSTFAVYGLAGLPAVIFIPLQLIEIIFPDSAVVRLIMFIAALAIIVWGIVLLTVGLREVHRFSTGKAIAVIVTPWAAAVVLGIIAVAAITGLIASIAPHLQQFGNF